MRGTNRRKAFERAVRRRREGFTLIEIMVVVVILGILAAIVAPNVMERIDRAKIGAAEAQIENLEMALKLFRLDHDDYPTTEQGLQALTAKSEGGGEPYVDVIPRDPWRGEYLYFYPGSDPGRYDIICYGADGAEGGEGKNADISNHTIKRDAAGSDE